LTSLPIPSSYSPEHHHISPPAHISTPPPFSSASTHHMQTRQKTNSLKPRHFSNHQIYTTVVTSSNIEPTCYTHAVKLSQWRQAMVNELTALALNST
jgi:hypothetical protein